MNLAYKDLTPYQVALLKTRSTQEFLKSGDSFRCIVQETFHMINSMGYSIVKDENKEVTGYQQATNLPENPKDQKGHYYK